MLAGAGPRIRRLLGGRAAAADPYAEARAAGAPAAALAAARDAEPAVGAMLERLAELGWRWLTPAAAEYPEGLTQLADPPLGLFVRGRLSAAPAVAVVGSRRATAYGRQVARELGRELTAAGAVVVSGMARGVDAAAHEGALEAGGPTVAVWGTGPDRVYPPEHGRLAAAIAEQGALVTEYPPGTPPRRHQFPERNRLVAGMARVVVVVEAAARSGALVTARLALEEGREVLAVPGRVTDELAQGPNALLRLGAAPCLGAADVLAELGLRPAAQAAQAADDGGVLGILPRGEALAVDELAARLQRELPAVLESLLELELSGAVERLPDGRFSRR